MRSHLGTWAGLFLLGAGVTLAAKYYAHFPGDAAVERWVQSLVPQDLHWAEKVSRTAEFPWVLLIFGLIFALSWIMAGWRAAVVSVLSLAGMLALGKWLGPIIARPRPSPELVRVFRPLSGYSFPSLFALRYGATFGFLALLAAWRSYGLLRTAVLIACGVLLIIGWVARVALAAHWPSDMMISYYLALLWAAFLIRLAPIMLGPFKAQES